MKFILLLNLSIFLTHPMAHRALGEPGAVTRCAEADVAKEEGTNSTIGQTPTMANERQVKAIEQKLSRLGYDPGEVDGNTDLLFECALIAFQKMNGLKSKPAR